MDNEELLNKIKIYEERILYLEKELNETKEHLKKYTAPIRNKNYYNNHKEDMIEKMKEYKNNLSSEKKKEYARTAYLKKKEKLEKEKIKNENI
jgi:hypothetical protein